MTIPRDISKAEAFSETRGPRGAPRLFSPLLCQLRYLAGSCKRLSPGPPDKRADH